MHFSLIPSASIRGYARTSALTFAAVLLLIVVAGCSKRLTERPIGQPDGQMPGNQVTMDEHSRLVTVLDPSKGKYTDDTGTVVPWFSDSTLGAVKPKASVEIEGGGTMAPALYLHPPHRANSYLRGLLPAMSLPSEGELSFQMKYGMGKGANCTDGVEISLLVMVLKPDLTVSKIETPATYFVPRVSSVREAHVDLSPWRGLTVRLGIQVNSLDTPWCDYLHVGNLELIQEPEE